MTISEALEKAEESGACPEAIAWFREALKGRAKVSTFSLGWLWWAQKEDCLPDVFAPVKAERVQFIISAIGAEQSIAAAVKTTKPSIPASSSCDTQEGWSGKPNEGD